jgi:hypothetical protein
MELLLAVQRLPTDLQAAIFRAYYTTHVVPCIPPLIDDEDDDDDDASAMSIHSLQSALSRANMYTRGTLDVTGVLPKDRRQVYAALRHSTMQVHVEGAGRVLVTTNTTRLSAYDDVASRPVSRLFLCLAGCGRYVVRWQTALQGWSDENEETAGWSRVLGGGDRIKRHHMVAGSVCRRCSCSSTAASRASFRTPPQCRQWPTSS